MDGAFHILGFPEPRDPDVVYVASRKGGLYLEESPEITEYNDMFRHLVARALGPDASRAMLENIADEMTGPAA
jgi:hypothetical protein